VFDRLIVAVATSKSKSPMFDLTKRVEFIKQATSSKNVDVKPFDSLLVDFAKKEGVYTIIRGLRAVSDFEYELQMSYANSSLDTNIDTIYFMPSLNNAFVSSSVVREVLRFGGDVSHLVPQVVYKKIKE
jgi:pantetheine-phosphate adenylyltransferase